MFFSRLTYIVYVFWLGTALHAQGVLGGAGSAAVDSKGFIYLAGTATKDLPATPGVLQPAPPPDCNPPDSCRHGFVAKLDPTGTSVVWLTFWGGDGSDSISALAVTPDGNVVIAGTTTSKNLPISSSGYQTKPASLFIAKLNADGTSLLAGTYFGGDTRDRVVALKLDRAGNIYVAGDAVSEVFPTTPGAYQTQRGTAQPPPQYYSEPCVQIDVCTDQFVAKFDPALAKLQFSSLFGTVIRESTGDLALGPDGTLYVSGVRGPFANQGLGPTNPILTRFSADASSVIYSVEVGRGYDGGPVVVDSDGNAYVASWSPRWIFSGPNSSTAKVDPHGTLLWERQNPAIVTSMALNSKAEIVATGLATESLSSTRGSPHICTSYTSSRPVEAYVSRRNAATGAITYTGFFNADQTWLVGPDQVLAKAAYVGLPQFSVLPAGNPPAGTITCVGNAANFDRTAIAPGEILSIFGTEIGPPRPVNAELDASGNVKKELGGVTVSIAGLPAPILYADAGQINLVAPFAIPNSGKVPVEIRRDGSLIAAFDEPVLKAIAALFTSDGSRSGPLAALNQDGSVNSASHPASLGSVVTVFGTGFGVMTQAVLDGATSCNAVSKPLAAFAISTAGASGGPVVSTQAEIEYIGNAPCSVQGAIQINLRVSDKLKPSDGVITLGIQSSFGTIAVR